MNTSDIPTFRYGTDIGDFNKIIYALSPYIYRHITFFILPILQYRIGITGVSMPAIRPLDIIGFSCEHLKSKLLRYE